LVKGIVRIEVEDSIFVGYAFETRDIAIAQEPITKRVGLKIARTLTNEICALEIDLIVKVIASGED
jgi:hypothetical protein